MDQCELAHMASWEALAKSQVARLATTVESRAGGTKKFRIRTNHAESRGVTRNLPEIVLFEVLSRGVTPSHGQTFHPHLKNPESWQKSPASALDASILPQVPTNLSNIPAI